MTGLEGVFLFVGLAIGGLAGAIGYRRIADERDAALSALRAAENARAGLEATKKYLTKSRDDWRDMVFDSIKKYNDKLDQTEKLLHGTEEALKFHEAALADANKEIAAFRFYSDEFCQRDESAEDAAHAMFDAVVRHRVRAEKAEEALKKAEANVAAQVGENGDEAKRLKRLFERMRHFNSHYVHGEWKKTECCACVSFIQKEYVDAALGTDA